MHIKKRVWIPTLIISLIFLIQAINVPKTDEQYYNRIKACSSLNTEIERDYCRATITEMYRGN